MMTSMLIDTTHHNRRSNTIPRKTLFWGLLIHIIRVSILVMDPSCSWGRRILRPKGSGKFELWKSSVWTSWRTLSVHPCINFWAIIVVHCGKGVWSNSCITSSSLHCISYLRSRTALDPTHFRKLVGDRFVFNGLNLSRSTLISRIDVIHNVCHWSYIDGTKG